MDSVLSFRKALAQRIATALGVSVALAAPALGGGCGANVTVDEGSGGGGGAGGGSSSANVGSSGTTGSTGSGMSACMWSVGAEPYAYLACITPSPVGCPDTASAAPAIQASLDECSCLKSVDSGPTPDPAGGGLCCYNTKVEPTCVIGRPLVLAEAPVVAPLGSARGWGEEAVGPRVADLPAEAREALAERWIRDGLFEHASIAAFSRLSLALLACGAPADLVRATHEAALDEVRHAQLSFSLASAYRGAPTAPAALPLPEALPLGADLVELAVSTALEGAVGETLAAVLAAEQASVATDPAVRAALLGIAADEGRHAELAWRVVAFAVAEGGERVRAAVASAFASAAARIPDLPPDPPVATGLLEAHGTLGRASARAAMARAMDEVVLPCSRAFLERESASAVVDAAC
jgi:hypothetical protein